MNALALHDFPERSGLVRWSAAALAILLIHVLGAAAIMIWHVRVPAEQPLPAIPVIFAPDTTAPRTEGQDSPLVEKVEDAPLEPPKIEQSVEQLMPPPPQPAEVVLPKPEPKVIKEQKKPIEKKQVEKKPIEKPRPAVEYSPPKTESAETRNVAASTAYNSLVVGHLQRFKRYPAAANGAMGKAIVSFTLNRQGQVLSSSLLASSGNAILDREALDTVRRANPFPPFPAEKQKSQESFNWPVNFVQR